VRALKPTKVIGTGLGGCDASLPPCVAATLSYLGVVGETSSCRLGGQRMVPLLMGNACPNVACWSAAVLPCAPGKMASGRVANAAQWGVWTASRWGTSRVVVHSAVLVGAGPMR